MKTIVAILLIVVFIKRMKTRTAEVEVEVDEAKAPPPIKVTTEWVKPCGHQGDWFLRNVGLKNKIKFLNFTDRDLKVRYKPKPLLNGLSIKGNGADFNNEYEWCEFTLYANDTYKTSIDTYRCTIEIDKFKLMCDASDNVVVREYTRGAAMVGCCVPLFKNNIEQ